MSGLVITGPASLPQNRPMLTGLSALVNRSPGGARPGDTVGTGAAVK